MNKTILISTLLIILASCSSEHNEEVAQDKEELTTITKAEDRNDLISPEDMKLKEAGENFLKENAARAAINTTESGLQYEIIQEGTGGRPNETHTITAHYTGMLIDGKVFDSSVERNEPLIFKTDQVIKGWGEGLQLMNKGAKYKFYIPYTLAYQAQGIPDVIPPYSTLIFEVELLDFK